MITKRFMLKSFTALMVLAVSLTMALPDQAQAKKMVLKFGHGGTEGTAMHVGWMKFKELVEARSKGEIVFEIYPNQQ